MGTQHRAPLAAFVLVTMVAGGIAVQATQSEVPTTVQDRMVAGSAQASPETTAKAYPLPTWRPAPTGAPRPMPAVPDPSAVQGRPGGVPPGLPLEIVSAIPGLAALLDGGTTSTGSSGPGEQAPSEAPTGPSPSTDPSSTPAPSGQPSSTPPATTPPSGEPSPSHTPSDSPSDSPSHTPSDAPSGSPSPSSTRSPSGAPSGSPSGSSGGTTGIPERPADPATAASGAPTP